MSVVGRLAGLLALVMLGIGLWLVVGRGDQRESQAVVPAGTPAAPHRPAVEAELAEREVLPAPEGAAAQRRVLEDGAESQIPAAAESADEALHPVVVRFVRGDRRKLTLESVSVTFTRESDGRQAVATGEDASELECNLPLGIWEIDVTAPGHRYVVSVHDWRDTDHMERWGDRGQPAFLATLYLWPENWLPVLVRTSDGRPYGDLARDRGLHPRRFFMNAFDVEASYDPEFPERGFTAEEERLYDELVLGSGGPWNELPAEFRAPRSYSHLPGLGPIAGSLVVTGPRPFWLRLSVFGVPHQKLFLPADATEAVFELDMDALAERFASVTLRLVDAGSGEPVDDASGTLKANNSSHRRHELEKVGPDENGVIRFRDVIPGPHDLLVECRSNFLQRKLTLEPGQALDLGDLVVEVGDGRPLRIRVVDVDGQPAEAMIEIAPYREGADVDDLYHPNLHRTTDKDGVYELPWPDVVSIVRARPLYFRGPMRNYQTIGTHNVLVDPEARIPELVLTAQLPVEVSFEPTLAWKPGHALTVVDEALDLVVERLDRPTKRVDLVPGPYVVERWDGAELYRAIDVVIGSEPVTLRVP